MFEYKKNLDAAIHLALDVLLVTEVKSLREKEFERLKAQRHFAPGRAIDGLGEGHIVEESKKNYFLEIFCVYFKQEYNKAKKDYESLINNENMKDSDFLQIVEKHSDPWKSLLYHNHTKGFEVIAEVLGQGLGAFFANIQYAIPSRFCHEGSQVAQYLVNNLANYIIEINNYFSERLRPEVWARVDFKSVISRIRESLSRDLTPHQRDTLESLIEFILGELKRITS